MTQTLPNDTGEIARPIDETLILDRGEATRNLTPYLDLPPDLRSADATEVIPVYEPPLFEQLADPSLTDDLLDDRPYPPVPVPVPPPNPSWNERFDELPLVRRSVPFVMPEDRAEWTGPRHRRDPKWAGRLVAIGSIVAIAAAFGAGVLAGVQL